ncbi:MAG: hypothetical protein ACR2HD_01120 [Solirubrobacteraceae bacterium]|nr:MAG: hypothetical protein DLM63_05265 [Solirubrobacterales bacterium]
MAAAEGRPTSVSGRVRLGTREASILTALIDAIVAPDAGMPEVRKTDAVDFIAEYLSASPTLNRIALRAALQAIELASIPRYRRGMRALARDPRGRYLGSLCRGPTALAMSAITALAKLAYYGDDAVLGSLGYEPEARIARGRALRAAEARW